jgi:hypothetical protein
MNMKGEMKHIFVREKIVNYGIIGENLERMKDETISASVM